MHDAWYTDHYGTPSTTVILVIYSSAERYISLKGDSMTTFFLFGSYSRESIVGIDARRTKKAEEIIEGFGGKLRSVYALLGTPDLVFIVDLPGIQEAMQASVAITRSTGVMLTTAPAIPVADFDRITRDSSV